MNINKTLEDVELNYIISPLLIKFCGTYSYDVDCTYKIDTGYAPSDHDPAGQPEQVDVDILEIYWYDEDGKRHEVTSYFNTRDLESLKQKLISRDFVEDLADEI